MPELLNIFHKLRRPNLLIRAARIAEQNYRRDKDLRRLLHSTRVPQPKAALSHLLAAERDLEAARQSAITTYSICRHVEILAALIAEVALLSPRVVS